jgi:hypothetical protein
MPTLSFDNPSKASVPIARVKGGSYDGEILYLSSDKEGAVRKPSFRFDRSKYVGALKGVKPAERTKSLIRIEEALHKNLDSSSLIGESADVKTLYDRIRKDASADTKIQLDDDGTFELLPSPDPKKREVWYISGQSGSGKSWIAKGLAHYYHKLFPDRGIYLISKLEEDETLDALKFLKRVKIQSFVDDYPALEEFKDCMVIFDDYDTLTGDAEKVIRKLIDDLAIMGRHTGTTMLCLSHYSTNYSKTRLLLNEITHLVVYPLSTSYHALKYILKNYIGVDEEDIKRHRKLGSRWLCYSKSFPQCLIAQKDAELLHQD